MSEDQNACERTETCREDLADYAHAAWSSWMEYLFSKCAPERGQYDRETGALIIPAWAVERWKRQLETEYKELPEKEKESDRKEADKILLIVNAGLQSKKEIERLREELRQVRATWVPPFLDETRGDRGSSTI